jgi:hypothetical protein
MNENCRSWFLVPVSRFVFSFRVPFGVQGSPFKVPVEKIQP